MSTQKHQQVAGQHYMAILPNTASSSKSCHDALPQGPKRLTLEEYFKRQQQIKEEKLTRIPPTEKPKHRRGGRIVRLRRQLAALKEAVNADPPPSWQKATQIWLQIDAVEAQMRSKSSQNTHIEK